MPFAPSNLLFLVVVPYQHLLSPFPFLGFRPTATFVETRESCRGNGSLGFGLHPLPFAVASGPKPHIDLCAALGISICLRSPVQL